MKKFIDAKSYASYLNRYNTTVLNSLVASCGFASQSKKIEKINAIVNGLKVYHENRLISCNASNLTILSIDVGVKNFSYCRSTNNDIYSNSRATVTSSNWQNLGLNEKFNDIDVLLNQGSILDSKRLLSHYANSIVNDVISSEKTHIVTIENQRTRSTGKSSTLPNVMLNYTLENMIYASFYTHQKYNKKLENILLVPLNSRNMVNFWINRFLVKDSVTFSASLTKKLRLELFLSWLLKDHGLFQLQNINIPLLSLLSKLKQSKLLLDALNENFNHPVKKLDDLIDSFLYNLMVKQTLANQAKLIACIESEGDLIELVHLFDTYSINLIRDMAAKNDLHII